MFSSSDESAIAFRLKTIWVMIVSDISFLSLLCLKFSSNLLETKNCGTELTEGLEDTKTSILNLRCHNKVILSWFKTKKGRIWFLLSSNSLSSRDLACHKHASDHLLFTAPSVQPHECVALSPTHAVVYFNVKGTWASNPAVKICRQIANFLSTIVPYITRH